MEASELTEVGVYSLIVLRVAGCKGMAIPHYRRSKFDQTKTLNAIKKVYTND